MQIYPTNTLTNFTTQLPSSLFLDGDWEVGLAEIQHPYTRNNIRSGKNRVYIKTWNERDYTSLEIPIGHYDNINNVTYNFKQLIMATNKFRKDDVDIRYASIDKRTSVYVANNCYLRLKGDVTTQLPNSLFLDGDWEVGLAEIQHPYTRNNIRSGKNRVYIKTWNERDYTSLEIPTGHYDNINNVTYNFTQLIFGYQQVPKR